MNSLSLIIQNLAVNSTSEKFDQAIKSILLSPLLLQSETEKSSSCICGSYVTVMHTQNERRWEISRLTKASSWVVDHATNERGSAAQQTVSLTILHTQKPTTDVSPIFGSNSLVGWVSNTITIRDHFFSIFLDFFLYSSFVCLPSIPPPHSRLLSIFLQPRPHPHSHP